uniref:Homeobox domain-containing protein n=1 Tax=Kalanchoe fedtschenkoi TaxID=63787 RepID=A0A7N0U3L6_KALFE
MDPISGRSSTRWNPTREQLSQLESLFNGQGIRTPTPAQINSIARRLLAYGPIKGKNVFYWFQNRKGRERRQKRKMERQQMSANTHNNINSLNNKNNIVFNNLNNNNTENVAVSGYFNRFYDRPPPSISPALSLTTGRPHSLFQTTPLSVGNLPYYAAQPRFGFFPHCPRTDLPSHLNSPMMFHPRNVISFATQSNEVNNAEVNDALFGEGSGSRVTPATLDLFPVHPTGILQERDDGGQSDGDSNLVIID